MFHSRLHSKRFFGLLALLTTCGLAVQAAGCGGDDDSSTPTPDSGTPDTNTVVDSGGGPDAADAADANTGPVFLDPSEYTDLFTIDPSFPYGVTARHAADGTIASSFGGGTKWGTTGPIVTAMPTVTSWTIPTDPKGAATSTMTTVAAASGVPTGAFYSSDGFVELPFALALQSYSTTGATSPGEALLYAPAFGSVASRAYANGFYSGVGITDGTTDEIVYAGLSPLTAAASTTNAPGLYAAPLCAGQLLATGSCAAAHQLFTWAGPSGAVVADTSGNVFVGAPLNAGGLDFYALTEAQALSATTATQATLGNDPTSDGTAYLAAAAVKGATDGWLVSIGYPDMTTNALPKVNGLAYTSSGTSVAKGTQSYATVITPTAEVTAFALFTDPDGNLWAGVTTATAGAFVELQKTQ